MTFVLEQIIGEIHQAYSDLTNTTICAELGNIEKARHADTPRIVWTLTGGTFGASTKIGGADAVQAQALTNFFVWLWFDDLEQCWNAMSNVLAAARRTVYGPNLTQAKFDVPTQIEGRNMDKGEVIIMTIGLSIPLRTDGTLETSEVELQTHSSTVTEDDGELNEDGQYVPFETVLVTGPIP